jgi:dTMP kinase
MPQLIFVLDMPAERSMERVHREHDRMESQGPEYLEQVRQGFLNEARRSPERLVIIDADRSIDAIQADVRREVARALAS